VTTSNIVDIRVKNIPETRAFSIKTDSVEERDEMLNKLLEDPDYVMDI